MFPKRLAVGAWTPMCHQVVPKGLMGSPIGRSTAYLLPVLGISSFM